jgi:SAM-dependent methyltransferase
MSKYGGYVDQPILAELYDLVPGYAKRTDVDFYLQNCAAAGGSILELGCGTGRILIPAAEAGCRITGLDVSEHMLAECRRKLLQKSGSVQSRVQLIQSDMTSFDLTKSFHLITIPFRAFLHMITVDDQLACLRRVNQHLIMGGQLILDVFQVDLKKITNPRATEESEDFAEYELPDGRRLQRTSRIVAFHRADQVNDIEMIYHLTNLDGTTERIVQAFPFRYVFRYEMEHLLARCGFKVVDLFGNFDRSPLADNSPEMIFVAEKCGNLD